MARYAAFLRGVNLAGKRKAPSAQLCAALEEAGFDEVATFRASGNVAFSDSGSGKETQVAGRVEEALAKSLGFDVVAHVRSAAQVRAIAGFDPFDSKLVERSDGKLQVALLRKSPSAAAQKQAMAMATDEDRLAIKGRELYWLPSGRMIESGLKLNALEKITGPWTMRTKGTMEQMAAKFFAG
jgi:uncharacterized protein (DUF1697 family)